GQPIDQARLRAALQTMSRRGPDDWGLWIGSRDGETQAVHVPTQPTSPFSQQELATCGRVHRDSVSIANTRLAITGEHGRQPMVAPGQAVLGFNGQAYNHHRLRRELQSLGHTFRGTSDTEVVLRGYLQWGAAVVSRIDGPFALVLWDSRRRKLVAARDRFGEKPLFAHQPAAFGSMIFSSQLRTLWAIGAVVPVIDVEVARSYVLDRRPPSGLETFFRQVTRVEPGHILEFSPDTNILVDTRFWQPPVRALAAPPVAEVQETMRALIREAVELTHPESGRSALCLSGGVDSGNLLAAAPNTPALTVYDPNGGNDERFHARAFAAAVGSVAPDEIDVGGQLDFATLCGFLGDQDEPPLNSGALIQWLLMKAMAKAGYRVVISGQGADELFWGYPWYTHGLTSRASVERMSDSQEFGSASPNMALSEADDLRHTELFRTRLPQHLRDDDTNSMAFGIESRAPYLTRNVVDYALSLPVSACLAAGVTKYPVRSAYADVLPEEIVWQTAKRGLYFDCAARHRSLLAEALAEHAPRSEVISGLIATSQTSARLQLDGDRLWRMFALAQVEADSLAFFPVGKRC
nr:asparagine synthase (glutamine-hydrolyzing) [Actinomycetes bacterium]